MNYEVVVVGAGLGGLTVAALLAARGVSVCVVERASQAGGCVAAFEKFGYAFEPTAGLYSGWGRGETHARLFAELSVAPPVARRLSPAYVVRLDDGAQVRVGLQDEDEATDELRAAFPECPAPALDFYDELRRLADADDAARAQASHRRQASHNVARTRAWLRGLTGGRRDVDRMMGTAHEELNAAREELVASRLTDASPRFRRFVDAQLQLFASCASRECSLLDAARALAPVRRGLYALAGGAQSHADALVESIRRSGGTMRFDATALRLAYDAAGGVRGVELLSSETVGASRAVVSNLTAWDTYGKLVGAGRTPADVRARLKNLRAWGAYLVLVGMNEETASRLPAERMILLNDDADGESDAGSSTSHSSSTDRLSSTVRPSSTSATSLLPFDAARSMFALGVAPASEARAPEGKRAVTLAAFADAAEWFAYHEDESEHETQDARALEFWWERLHRALPQIADGAEVIETLTPRTYYEQTRRRLGSVWGLARTPESSHGTFSHRTHLPKLFMVGDTVAVANGVEAVTRCALAVADEIAPRR